MADAALVATDAINSVQDDDGRSLLILYGSETGNSQDAADDLERIAQRLRFHTHVSEMDDATLNDLLQYTLVVFVLSTTGQGELPRNSRKFWKSLLRKRLPPSCLSPVKFTTFGLGDSSYAKFNFAARKLHKRLEQLGAIEFYSRGEADEQHEDGIDGSYIPWSTNLKTHLLSTFPLPEGISAIPQDVHLPPKFTLELLSDMDANDPGGAGAHKEHQELDRVAARFSHVDSATELDELELREHRLNPRNDMLVSRGSQGIADALIPEGVDRLDQYNILKDDPSKYNLKELPVPDSITLPPQDFLPIPNAWDASLLDNKRITPEDHWQDVRLLTFVIHPDVDETLLEYCPGDVLVIYPKNYPEDVQKLIDLMDWGGFADKPVAFRSAANIGTRPDAIPCPKGCYPLEKSTLRDLLTHNFDITAIPKRIFFDHLAFFTADEFQRERLREFSDPKYTDEFYDYTSRPRRSILEVLEEFSTVQIPYEWVPTIFPVMRPREYSIASGGPLAQYRGGLKATQVQLLVALVKYKTVLRKTRRGLCSRYFEFLQPGTKVRVGYKENVGPPINRPWDERPLIAIAPGTGVAPMRSLIWHRHLDQDRGETLLFYGGRNRNADFFFEDDWLHTGVTVCTAFSRDQREKIYVQDVIRREADRVCRLIEQGAQICLCGSAGKMPLAVKQAITDALVIGRLVPDENAAMKRLESVPLWEEVW